MSTSAGDFYHIIRNFILLSFPSNIKIIDVGPGCGTYARLLPEIPMDCVEVFEPYIEKYQLRKLYRNVHIQNVMDFDFTGYDLAIFGDILEHLTVEAAVNVLSRAPAHKIVQVPYLWGQDIIEDNPYEIHLQADLTHDVFMQRYGQFGFKLMGQAQQLGVFFT